MKILTAKSNDPIHRLEAIMDAIRSSEYPNAKSIMNDQLRNSLRISYNLNLNMLDTHHFVFGSYTGICESDNFYIYEGNGDTTIIKTYKEQLFGVYGIYPEGVFLGFIDSRLRDEEFRKNNIDIFFNTMIQLGTSYKKFYKNRIGYAFIGGSYINYIDMIPYIFAYRQLFKFYKDITQEEMSKISDKAYANYFFEIREKFMKVTNTFDYAKVYSEVIKLIPILFGSNTDNSKMNLNNDKEISNNTNVENKDEEVTKEFHLYMYDPLTDEGMEEAAVCFDYEATKYQLDIKANYIITTQTSFLSTKLLKDGYKIYIHFKDGYVKEVRLGINDWSTTPIKTSHNLERLLYNGIIHKVEGHK